MRIISLLALAFVVSANATELPQVVNQQSIIEPGSEWLSYGRTYKSSASAL